MSELILNVTPDSATFVSPTLAAVHSVERTIDGLWSSIDWREDYSRSRRLVWLQRRSFTSYDASVAKSFGECDIRIFDQRRFKSGFYFSFRESYLVMPSYLAVCLRGLMEMVYQHVRHVYMKSFVVEPFLYDYFTFATLKEFFDECEDIQLFRVRSGIDLRRKSPLVDVF